MGGESTEYPPPPPHDGSTYALFEGFPDRPIQSVMAQPLPIAELAPQITEPVTQDDGERRYSFNFQDAPWNWVLKKFSEEAGLSLQMTAAPLNTFTYFDRKQYTLVEALDIFNDSLLAEGFIAIRNRNSLTVLEAKAEIPEGLIPMVSLDEVASLGRNELASVAIPVHNGLAASAAEELLAILSPIGRAKPLSSSQRVLITDVGGGLRRVQRLNAIDDKEANAQVSFVYQLRNTPAEDVALAISDFLDGRRPSISQTGANSPGTGSSRGNSGIMPAGGFPQNTTGLVVIAEKTTNSLLIRGTAQEVAEIQDLIVQLDRIPAQVVIQALLVEVELGDTDEFGVELGVQDSVLFDRSVIDKLVTINSTNTAPNGVQTTTQNILSQTSMPGFNFNNQPLGNNTAIQPSRVGSQALSGLGVGRVNGDLGFGGLVLAAGSESISVLLRALQQNYNVDILSRPQIRSLDNHEALIQIGKQVPVVDGVSITAVGSANPVIRQDQSGIILRVVPRISPDGQVLIDVKAEKSAYLLTPGTGVPIFTDATNGNVIEAPVKDITTATTTVNVKSGQTIVLGGMITRDTANLTRKVPFLGDIPFVGAAFRYNLNETKRKELLIFLTPIIIEGDEDADRLKLEEMQRISMPYGDAAQIHGHSLEPLDPSIDPFPTEEPGGLEWDPGSEFEGLSPETVSPSSDTQPDEPSRWLEPGESTRVRPHLRRLPSGVEQTPSVPSDQLNDPLEQTQSDPQAQHAAPPKKRTFRDWKPFGTERGHLTSEAATSPEQTSPQTGSNSNLPMRIPRKPNSSIKPAAYTEGSGPR